MAEPTFYPEGNEPMLGDTQRRIEMKILGAIRDGGGGVSSYAAGGNFSGSGSPEGVVTASPGATYVDTDAPGTMWFKRTGTGNTGWV